MFIENFTFIFLQSNLTSSSCRIKYQYYYIHFAQHRPRSVSHRAHRASNGTYPASNRALRAPNGVDRAPNGVHRAPKGLIELEIGLIELKIGLTELQTGLIELVELRSINAWRTVLARVSGLVILFPCDMIQFNPAVMDPLLTEFRLQIYAILVCSGIAKNAKNACAKSLGTVHGVYNEGEPSVGLFV